MTVLAQIDDLLARSLSMWKPSMNPKERVRICLIGNVPLVKNVQEFVGDLIKSLPRDARLVDIKGIKVQSQRIRGVETYFIAVASELWL